MYVCMYVLVVCHDTLLPLWWCEGDWQHWSERVPEYIYPSDSVPEFATILVPNVDNIRTNFLMDTIAKQRKVISYHVAGNSLC